MSDTTTERVVTTVDAVHGRFRRNMPDPIPVVILGLAMLAFLSRVSLSGEIHAVVIAHVVMCAPFAMAILRLRLSQMDPSLEAAAWNLGASEWKAMRHVIIPFCKPAIMAESDDYVAFGSEYRALSVLPSIEKARVFEPEPATVYAWERA